MFYGGGSARQVRMGELKLLTRCCSGRRGVRDMTIALSLLPLATPGWWAQTGHFSPAEGT
jgi:hypothetical protein